MQKFFEFSGKSIFIIVLSIIYFYVKGDLTYFDSFSYAFILCAYLIFILAPYFTKNMVNKTVQIMPLYAVSFIYLFIQIIAGIYVSVYYYDINFYSYIAVQSIMAGIYLIILFSILYSNETTYRSIQVQYSDVQYLKNIKLNLKNILLQTENENMKHLIEDLIDAVQASPTKSNEELYDLENEILDITLELENLVKNNEDVETIKKKCLNIHKLLSKRNNTLKVLQYRR